MDKYFIIKNFSIAGVDQPFLRVEGKAVAEIDEYHILADDTVITVTPIIINRDVSIEAKIPKGTKKVILSILVNNKNITLLKLNTNRLSRSFNSVGYHTLKMGRKIKKAYKISKRGVKYLWVQYHFLVPPRLWKEYLKKFINKVRNVKVTNFYDPFYQDDYLKWVEENKEEVVIEKQEYNPLISILIPVYNVDRQYLVECLDSILNQTYPNFEVCLVDDCSTKQETKDTLEEYTKKDSRIKIKYRSKNGHISNATNDALNMASGEYIALVDNDDTLDLNALYEVVKVLNKNKKIDMLYTDEDKLDLDGKRCNPHFKPGWSPDTLMSLNYICHLLIIRRQIVDKIGGFTVGLEGAQDYDLVLRVTEVTNNIYHLPKILYHWRMIKGSTSMTMDNKSYAQDKGKSALENTLKRRKIKGHIEKEEISKYYRVVYEYDKEPMISIIIPTRDYAHILKPCLESIYNKTDYHNYEVIIVNNNSEKEETFKLLDKYKQHPNFRVIDANIEFNYSRINNLAVNEAKGEYVVLLNNDTEIISPDWLKIMVGYAMQPHIGVVGVKLLYPDTTIQHGGVILGLGGIASHAYLGEEKEATGTYGRLMVPYNYAAVTAACLMIEKKKYNEVCGLEEDLKVAYNDVDFCIKLLKKGYYNVFIPQVEITHHESKTRGLDTTKEKYERFQKEENYMYNKWPNEISNDPFYNPNYSKKMWFVLNKKSNF